MLFVQIPFYARNSAFTYIFSGNLPTMQPLLKNYVIKLAILFCFRNITHIVFTRLWLLFGDIFGISILTGCCYSVAKFCVTLWDPMNRSTPGLPVHHELLELTQTHAHWVGDSIQPSHPLSFPSPATNPSQHQGHFQWVNPSHEVAKVLEFQPQHQSFQWTPRTGLL